jgi:hypothetical protein
MSVKLVLSAADRGALIVIVGLALGGCLSYIAGASRAARLFAVGTFVTTGLVTLVAVYARL